MLKNYFKIAWRNLLKQRAFSCINIFGLAAGLTCFLLIALFLADELTFDGFHTKEASLYRVTESYTTPTGKERTATGVAFNTSAIALKEIPEVEASTRVTTYGRVNVQPVDNKDKVTYNFFSTADAAFLHLF